MKLIWRAFETILLYTLLATQNGRLLCACVVPRLMHNLYMGWYSLCFGGWPGAQYHAGTARCLSFM